MPLKQIVRFDHGLTWVMDEWMQRASHALLIDGKVWLIDPVDEPEAIEAAQQLGPIGGVIQLLDRHPRACRALSERFDVPLHRLPDASSGVIPGTPLEVIDVVRHKKWQERALWWPATGTLVVAETVGTNAYYALSGELGVHIMLRATKVTVGQDLDVEHLLVGHGLPLHEACGVQLRHAYSRRLRDLVRLPLAIRAFLPGR